MHTADIATMNIGDVRRELEVARIERARLTACETELVARMKALLDDAEQREVAGVRIVDDC